MKSTPVAIFLILGSLFVGGVGGWHLRGSRIPEDPEPITSADSLLRANADALARADTFLHDTVFIPIYIRTNGAKRALAGADTGRLFSILDAEPSTGE